MNKNKFDKIKVIDDCACTDSSISAIGVKIPNHGYMWIPNKEISIESEVKEIGDKGKLIITQWLAKEKHLL